jgi:hypothetical protein
LRLRAEAAICLANAAMAAGPSQGIASSAGSGAAGLTALAMRTVARPQ